MKLFKSYLVKRALILFALSGISSLSLAQGFDERYEAWKLTNGDIYIKQNPDIVLLHGDIITPIVLPAPVEEFVLLPQGQGYSTSSDTSGVNLTGAVQVDVSLGDFNVDGLLDIVLKDIATNVFDQIVFADAAGVPQVVTTIDVDLQQFFEEVYAWMLNPDYFEENAPLISQTITTTQILFNGGWFCDPPPYNDYTSIAPPTPQDYESFEEAVIVNAAWVAGCVASYGIVHTADIPIRFPETIQVPDFSVFNQDAVLVTQDIESVVENNGSVEGVANLLSENMGVDVFGTGDSPITDSEEDVPEHLRGRTRLQLFLLNILKVLGDNPNTGEYHEIEPVVTEICSTTEAGCTVEEVFCELRTYPAPGMWSNDAPVQDGEVNNAEIGYQNTTVDDLGPVVHDVDEVNNTVTNSTLPGHLLHPGTVVRSVEQVGDTIFVRTEGDGTGAYPNTNEILAEDLWTITDSQIISEQSKKVLGGNSCLE